MRTAYRGSRVVGAGGTSYRGVVNDVDGDGVVG